MEDGIFSLEDIDFGINHHSNKKSKQIEEYQVEILKIGGFFHHPLHPQAHQSRSQNRFLLGQEKCTRINQTRKKKRKNVCATG